MNTKTSLAVAYSLVCLLWSIQEIFLGHDPTDQVFLFSVFALIAIFNAENDT